MGATGAGEIEVDAVPVAKVKSAQKKVYTEVNLDASNEIVPVAKADLEASLAVKAEAQPAVIVKEVSNWKDQQYQTSTRNRSHLKHITSGWFSVPQAKFSLPMWYMPLQYIINRKVCSRIKYKFMHQETY